MPDSGQLREEHANLVQEARELINYAESENRDLNGEEKQKYDRLDAEIEEKNQRIERVDKEDKRLLDNAPPPVSRPGEQNAESQLESEFRALANGDQRHVNVSFTSRDLTTGTATAGGNTVPTSFVQQLYEYMTERSAIRQTNVTVLTTDSGEKLLVPKVTGHSSAGLTSEASAIPENDPTFGQAELDGYKYGNMSQYSHELMTDTGVNLLDFVSRDAGRAIGEATGAAYVNGDGASKPTGILQDSTLGATAADTNGDGTGDPQITSDAIMDLFFSVIGPYRQNGYWMLNDATLSAVRKLKDQNGQFLWEPSLTAGTPNMLLGRPVVTDHNMPGIATGNNSVLFGDFSGYYIRDVGELRFERSDHYAFNQDLVTFRSLMRTDGKLVDTSGAVKHLQHD